MSECSHVRLAGDGMMTACEECHAYFEARLEWSPDYRWWFKTYRLLRIESEEQAEVVRQANPQWVLGT